MPLRSNGGGAPSIRPLPGCRSLVATSLLLCLSVGGLCRSWAAPPSLVSGHSRWVCAPAWGIPLLPPLGQGSSPPPSPSCRARGVHTAREVTPLPSWSGDHPLPLLHTILKERTLLRGCPPFALLVWCLPPPLCRTRGTHAAQGVPPPSPSWSEAHHPLSCMLCAGITC